MNPFLASIFASARRELAKAREYQRLVDDYRKLVLDDDLDTRRRLRGAENTRDHYVRRAMAYRLNAKAFRLQLMALSTSDTQPPTSGATAA